MFIRIGPIVVCTLGGLQRKNNSFIKNLAERLHLPVSAANDYYTHTIVLFVRYLFDVKVVKNGKV